MAITTPLDLIKLALKTSGAIGVGQTPLEEDTNDSFNILNTILTEWQLNRWLVYDLLDVIKTSTGAVSYTVGPSGDFDFIARPDKIDAVVCRLISSGADSFLFPFMSREGYDRVATVKTTTGVPATFFYDSTLTTFGTLYLWPVPSSSYSIHVQAKASLGQFATLTQSITLPPIYTTALLWNLAASLRPLYQLPPDEAIATRAKATLQTVINSIAQVPQTVTPETGNRAGIYSQFVSGT